MGEIENEETSNLYDLIGTWLWEVTAEAETWGQIQETREEGEMLVHREGRARAAEGELRDQDSGVGPEDREEKFMKLVVRFFHI